MTSLRHERAHQFGSKWPPKWEACKQQLSQDVLRNKILKTEGKELVKRKIPLKRSEKEIVPLQNP